MKSAECNGYSQPSGWKTHDGRVWFPTVHGAVAFDPRNVRQSARPPRVVIERVDAGSRWFPAHSGRVTLPAGTSDFEVQFAAIALSGAEGVQFRYRLDGFDKDWVAAGQRRSAFYTNLPPGDFQFRVMAESHAGTAPGQEATLALRLEPRFVQRPEFLLICIVLAAAAGWAAYRLHLRAIHRRYQAVVAERTRIGREIHDTLMQGVAGITLQLEVAANKLNGSPAEAEKQLHRALTQLDAVLMEARECILQLRSPTTSADLVQTVRQLAAEMSGDRGLPIDVSVEGVPRPLADPLSRNLLRIVREALTNAVNHSMASHIDMTLRFDTDAVRVQVSDNGRGFNPSALDSRHFGLVGMRERTREAGGDFALSTEPGRGTRVEVAIPDRRRA
jgi:signal transduction histidine kinase